MEANILIAWFAAIIAGLSALSSIQGMKKSRSLVAKANDYSQSSNNSAIEANNYAKQANDFANIANNHLQNQNIVHANEWTGQYFHNVKTWADEACDCISAAVHLHELEDKNEIRKTSFELRSKLSSIIDRGRWYFPNRLHNHRGLHKELAFRGERQPLLDSLVHAYDMIGVSHESSHEIKSELVRARRFFVSEMQEVLNPRKRKEEIDHIAENFKILDELNDFRNKKFKK